MGGDCVLNALKDKWRSIHILVRERKRERHREREREKDKKIQTRYRYMSLSDAGLMRTTDEMRPK